LRGSITLACPEQDLQIQKYHFVLDIYTHFLTTAEAQVHMSQQALCRARGKAGGNCRGGGLSLPGSIKLGRGPKSSRGDKTDVHML
jgi:hypothetical protein